MSLIGALGVFGLQDGASFLIAWEIMSFGGAVMILSEKLSCGCWAARSLHAGSSGGRSSCTLVAVILLLAYHGARILTSNFFDSAASRFAYRIAALAVGILLVIGFGAKLGLLPFYEWFPGAYGAGSGASGALLSGVVLNAAFFGLSRGLLDWLPGQDSVGMPQVWGLFFSS